MVCFSGELNLSKATLKLLRSSRSIFKGADADGSEEIDAAEFHSFICDTLHLGRLYAVEAAAMANRWKGAEHAAFTAAVEHAAWPAERRQAWLVAAGPAAGRAAGRAAGDSAELGRLVLAECQRQLAAASIGAAAGPAPRPPTPEPLPPPTPPGPV